MTLKVNVMRYSNPFKYYNNHSKNREFHSVNYPAIRRRNSSNCFASGMKCSDDKWMRLIITMQERLSLAIDRKLMEDSDLRGIFI